MFEMAAMRSPLNSIHGEDVPHVEFNGVTLTELPFLRHYNVRFQPDDQQASSRFRQLLGFDAPQGPNIFVVHEDNLCAWLGPDEWLIVTPFHAKDSLDYALNEFAYGDAFVTRVDISAAQTIIRATGPKAADLLGRGVSYDLHPRNFQAGSCIQTVLARASVTLFAQSAAEVTIDIVVRRSFAEHLWNWLVDAGQESEFHSL